MSIKRPVVTSFGKTVRHNAGFDMMTVTFSGGKGLHSATSLISLLVNATEQEAPYHRGPVNRDNGGAQLFTDHLIAPAFEGSDELITMMGISLYRGSQRPYLRADRMIIEYYDHPAGVVVSADPTVVNPIQVSAKFDGNSHAVTTFRCAPGTYEPTRTDRAAMFDIAADIDSQVAGMVRMAADTGRVALAVAGADNLFHDRHLHALYAELPAMVV
jgi:hypothetical protein